MRTLDAIQWRRADAAVAGWVARLAFLETFPVFRKIKKSTYHDLLSPKLAVLA